MCVDLRKRFEQEPINTHVKATSTVQLQCLPPPALPAPQVSLFTRHLAPALQQGGHQAMLRSVRPLVRLSHARSSKTVHFSAVYTVEH